MDENANVFRPHRFRIVDTTDSGYAEAVPYELSFTAAVTVMDGRSRYINDCCWGGDVIRDRFMPVVVERYHEIRTEQEDWGWFIWFRDPAIRLAVDIFCDDIASGAFIINAPQNLLSIKVKSGNQVGTTSIWVSS